MKASYEELELKKEKLEQEMRALLEKLQSMMMAIKREADQLRDEMQQSVGQVKLYKEENETLKAQVYIISWLLFSCMMWCSKIYLQLEKQRKEIVATKEEQIVKANLVEKSVPNTTDTGSQTDEVWLIIL